MLQAMPIYKIGVSQLAEPAAVKFALLFGSSASVPSWHRSCPVQLRPTSRRPDALACTVRAVMKLYPNLSRKRKRAWQSLPDARAWTSRLPRGFSMIPSKEQLMQYQLLCSDCIEDEPKYCIDCEVYHHDYFSDDADNQKFGDCHASSLRKLHDGKE